MKKFVPIIILTVAILSSCTVATTVSLDSNNIAALYQPKDFFISVVEDLSSWQESGSDEPVMDVAARELLNNINKSDTVKDAVIQKLEENFYALSFDYADFQVLAADLTDNYPDQKLITCNPTEDGKTRFELNISLETYDVLASVVPILNDENFRVWGPVYNNPPYDNMSEEDYKDMVSWILGEDGPQSIDESVITIMLSTPDPISATNGTKINENSVVFSFRLIDFLLLHEPIIVYCEF